MAEVAHAYSVLFDLANPAVSPKLAVVQSGALLKAAFTAAGTQATLSIALTHGTVRLSACLAKMDTFTKKKTSSHPPKHAAPEIVTLYRPTPCPLRARLRHWGVEEPKATARRR